MGFEIFTTETLGFCFGVDRAVTALYERIKAEHEAHSGRKIYTYGPIIHNPDINEDLRSNGVEVIDDVSQAAPGDSIRCPSELTACRKALPKNLKNAVSKLLI